MKNAFFTVPARVWHLHYTLLVDWEVGISVAKLFGFADAAPDDSFTGEYEARISHHGHVKVSFTAENIQFALSIDGRCICVGVCSPASNLPAFRFSEVLSICDSLDGGDSIRKNFLLLLAPACNDNDLADITRFRDALRFAWLSIVPNPNMQLIEQIVDATCRANVHWSPDPANGWVNSGSHSYRNPNRATPMPQSDFLVLKRFFHSIGG